MLYSPPGLRTEVFNALEDNNRSFSISRQRMSPNSRKILDTKGGMASDTLSYPISGLLEIGCAIAHVFITSTLFFNRLQGRGVF